MDLFDVVRSCARRWYVFLPLLLVTAWYSYSVFSSVQPVYYSQAVIGLAPPSSRVENVPQGQPVSRNALLDIGGASLVANMTALGLKEAEAVDRVVAAGGQPDYIARMFPTPATSPPLPMILVEYTNADPAAVTKTLELVIAQADATVRNLQAQAQVPTNLMVAPFVVSPPSPPAAGMPSRTRSTIAIFIAGAGLSVLLTVVVDVFLMRRKSRVRKRRQVEVDTAAEPSPAPPQRDTHEQQEIHERDEDAPAAEGVMGSR